MKLILVIWSAVFAWLALPAQAQSSYPDKPIRLMIGFPPGGSVDFAPVLKLFNEGLKAITKPS